MSPEHARAALVRFLTSEEGGRVTPPETALRSQIALPDFQTSCIVSATSGATTIPLGEPATVWIEPVLGDEVGAAFRQLTTVELFEGNKLIGEGRFTF